MTAEMEAFKGWALVELMGHRKRAGLCEDVVMCGTRLLRVDVPDEKDPAKFTTEFYGGSAIYGLHPCDEAIGRRLAKDHRHDRAIEPYRYQPEEQLRLEMNQREDEDEDEDL